MSEIKLIGDKRLARKLRRFKGNVPNEVLKKLFGGGLAIEKTMKISIAKNPRSGRVVTRYVTPVIRDDKIVRYLGKRTIRISRRGDAPAGDTGFLANSIRTRKLKNKTVEVKVGAKYGKKLEKKYNRPFMQPAFDENIPAIRRNVKRAIIRELRKNK